MVFSTSRKSKVSLGWNHSGQSGSVAHEAAGEVRVSLDERGAGAMRLSVALVGRHVVRWLKRKMSSNCSPQRKVDFVSWLAILTEVLTWDICHQENDRSCAYKIKSAELATARALM